MSTVYKLVIVSGDVGMSLKNIVNKSGERQDPCGTPAFITPVGDRSSPTLT